MTAIDQVQAAAVRGIVALHPRVKRRLAGPPIVRDGLELDLDAQLLLRAEQVSPRPPVEERPLPEARADFVRSCRVVAGPALPLPLPEVRDLRVAGADGPLPARLYVPTAPTGALLVFFHGGGWTVGNIDTHDATCRLLAHHAGARVLSVDYRLAPESPFPGPVDDALAAFRDAVARADELGADPARVAVGGDSAGGHLSASVALRAVADGGPAPAFQLLIYPALDFVEDRPSVALFGDGFLLTKRNMDFYETQLLGAPDGRSPLAEQASPLRAADLAGVAPAHVITAGFDPLRDEGEAYAERLRAAGVPTVLRRHPGQIHGFFNMVGVGRAPAAAVAEAAGVLRAGLEPR